MLDMSYLFGRVDYDQDGKPYSISSLAWRPEYESDPKKRKQHRAGKIAFDFVTLLIARGKFNIFGPSRNIRELGEANEI